MELLVVLVLYEMRLDQSPTFRSLRRCLEAERIENLHLLVYDNSRTPLFSPSEWPNPQVTFRHDPANGGLGSAYNTALEIAVERSAEWILLLDQDSDFSVGFIGEVLSSISEYNSQADVAAIVPAVLGQDALISPKEVHIGCVTDLKDRTPGRRENEITGINSGMALRSSFMCQVGGFNRTYWLDFMDYWIFKTIYKNGAVAVLSHASMRHSLSLEARSMSNVRYANMLKAESTFVLKEGQLIEVPLYIVRLFIRACKNVFIRRSIRLGWITAKMAFSILWKLKQVRYENPETRRRL